MGARGFAVFFWEKSSVAGCVCFVSALVVGVPEMALMAVLTGNCMLQECLFEDCRSSPTYMCTNVLGCTYPTDLWCICLGS